MSEMALTADHLIVIGRGRLIADTSVSNFIQMSSATLVHVRTPEAARLQQLLGPDRATSLPERPDVLEIRGMSTDEVGDIAFRNDVPLYELTAQQASLEEAFMNLTRNAVEFTSERHDRAEVAA
jgi:ABC-2 type transport system ATP-binding protein